MEPIVRPHFPGINAVAAPPRDKPPGPGPPSKKLKTDYHAHPDKKIKQEHGIQADRPIDRRVSVPHEAKRPKLEHRTHPEKKIRSDLEPALKKVKSHPEGSHVPQRSPSNDAKPRMQSDDTFGVPLKPREREDGASAQALKPKPSASRIAPAGSGKLSPQDRPKFRVQSGSKPTQVKRDGQVCAPVITFPNLNKLFFGYFDPEKNFFR